jgi:hypothetical protein
MQVNSLHSIPTNIGTLSFTAKRSLSNGFKKTLVALSIDKNDDGGYDVNRLTIDGNKTKVYTEVFTTYSLARKNLVSEAMVYTFVHSVGDITFKEFVK